MLHYENRMEARVGDLVFGQGYNVPLEICGIVLAVELSSRCNLRIAYPDVIFLGREGESLAPLPGESSGTFTDNEKRIWGVRVGVEYGQADRFRLLRRATGESLADVPAG